MSDELPKEVREAVVYLVAAGYDAGKHGATDSSSVRDASKELGFALARHITAELAAARLQLEQERRMRFTDNSCTGHVWTKRGTVADGDFCKRCGTTRTAGGRSSDTEPGTP